MDNKLTTFKEILLLWKKHIVILLLVVSLVFGGTMLINKLYPLPIKHNASATISISLRNNGVLDYDTSVKKAFALVSLEKEPYSLLENGVSDGTTISLKHISDTNLVNITALSPDYDNVVNYANGVASSLVSKYNNSENTSEGNTENTTLELVKKADNYSTILGFRFPFKLRIVLTLFALFITSSIIIAFEIMRTKVVNIDEAKNAINSKLVFSIGNKDNILLLPRAKYDTSNDIDLIKECLSSINNGKFPNKLLLLPIGKKDYDFNIAKLIAKEIYNDDNIATTLDLENNSIEDKVVAISPSLFENTNILNLVNNFDYCIFLIKSNTCEYNNLKHISELCENSGITIKSLIINYI